MHKIHGIIVLIAVIAVVAVLGGCGTNRKKEPVEASPSGKPDAAGSGERTIPAAETVLFSEEKPPSLDEIPVSRAMVAKMLALTMLTADEIDEMPMVTGFQDVNESDWHYKYINASVSLKYMFGGEDGFGPDVPLSIYEAQLVIDRVNPNNKTQIKITPETKNLPISYALWNQLYLAAIEELAAGKGEAGANDIERQFGLVSEELFILATPGSTSILPQWSMVTDKGAYFFKGLDMNAFLDKKISVYAKQKEIVLISEIASGETVIENAYVSATREGYLDVFAGGARRTYKTTRESVVLSNIADVKISGKTAEITAYAESGEKREIKRVTPQYVELSDGKLDIDSGFPVYALKDGTPVYRGTDGLIVGSAAAVFFSKDGKICAAVIEEPPKPDKIRVLITSSDYRMTVHTSVKISSDSGFSVQTGEGVKEFAKGEVLTFDKENNAGLFSSERIYIKPVTDGFIELQSVKRGESSPKYRGTIEISKEGEAFVVINELDFEQYLYSVVSSQISGALGLTAATAQAVVSRSCAYNQFYLNRFAYYGANVDDSSKSQLYNAIAENETSIKAVDSTKGQLLSYGGEIIKPAFFMASGGSTANRGETWQKADGTKFPSETPGYLKAAKQLKTGEYGDLSNEGNAARFFKDSGVDALEKGIPWFRWSVRMEKADVEASINANIKERQKAYPSQVLTLTEGGYARRPVESIGQLIEMEVLKRGEGGNIMELKIKGTNGEYLLKTENCVRQLIRPYQYDKNKPPVSLGLSDGSKIDNYLTMPSAFYVFDVERGNQGEINAVTFYGGGNGHGVGMSQYGAKALADGGASYENILKHYFSGSEIVTES